MKKMILLFIAFCSFVPLFSQEWAAIGTQWFYTERFAFSGDVDYLMFTSVKDTVFEGIPCRKLEKRHELVCTDRPLHFEITFSRNDSIFFYDPNFSRFQMLCDFNAQTGESWDIVTKNYYNPPDTDTIRVLVDSVTTININGIDLKKWYVTYHCFYDDPYNWTYSSEIIEYIGDVNYLFNLAPSFNMVCDANWADGLRCYEDPYIGFYNTGIADSCDYISVGIPDISPKGKMVNLYPNPAEDYLVVKCTSSSGLWFYSIVDILGKTLISQTFSGEYTKIDIGSLNPGIYFFRINNDNEEQKIQFIVAN